MKKNKVKTTRHLQIGLSKLKAREEKQPAAYYPVVSFPGARRFDAMHLEPKLQLGKLHTRSWNWFWSETR